MRGAKLLLTASFKFGLATYTFAFSYALLTIGTRSWTFTH